MGSKSANVATKLVLSSGRLSQMNMEFNPMECTRERVSFNWNELMYTTMKPVYDQDLTDRFSDQTTSCLDNLEPETTGPKVTTLRELRWYWLRHGNPLDLKNS